MKTLTHLLMTTFALLSSAMDAGPTFKLDAGIISNNITFVETTLALPKAPDYQFGNLNLWPGWYGASGFVHTQAMSMSIRNFNGFDCGVPGEDVWCVTTSANQCDDRGCQDVYGAKVAVQGNSNVTIRNSILPGTSNVLQELIVSGKTVSNLTTRN
jgi:hypothetical protein